MKKILVTGGAGYIGSHTCKALAAAGFEPITYDNLGRGHRQAVQWGPFYQGDLFDPENLIKTMKTEKVEAVIHFAAFAYIKESVEKPLLYFENNVMGTAMLLEAMLEAGVANIVFSSSCATYGESTSRLIAEDHPQKPINPYGLSKWMTEQMLKKYRTLGLIDFCALRYFNAAGADPEGEIGESHDPEPHIIPTFIKLALQNKSMAIFGHNYPTSDGTCVRDFVHVSDLAVAHVLALEKLLKKENRNNFYNLGRGKGFSLKEIASHVSQIMGQELKIEFRPRRDGDPAQLVGDAQRFQSEYNWNPQLSDIATLLETAIRWEKTRKF